MDRGFHGLQIGIWRFSQTNTCIFIIDLQAKLAEVKLKFAGLVLLTVHYHDNSNVFSRAQAKVSFLLCGYDKKDPVDLRLVSLNLNCIISLY